MKFCVTAIFATLCTLTSSTLAGGGALAWGFNSSGQATVPNTAKSNVTAITGGYLHTLAIKDGGVLAWGDNYYSQTSVPNSVSSSVTNIAAGMYHSLALVRSGSLVAWGYNYFGQCNLPTSIANSGISAVAAGNYHSLIVKNGSVFAFGLNNYGQCNLEGTQTGFGVTSVAGGKDHSAALKAGAVLVWGNNFYDQRTIPNSATSGITEIACGTNHTIALKDSGHVIGWGDNSYGQCLGTNSAGAAITTNANGTAVKINGVTLTGVTAIAGGSNHTVALRDGAVLAWGYNYDGQCTIPTSATSGVTAIGAGSYHTVAVGVAIIDPCDVDANGTLNADEPGAATSMWLFPNITNKFENPANWSAGIPGYNTTAFITGNPQIEFGCDNSVKTLELSTGSSNWYPGLSLNLNSHSLTVYGGLIAFRPGAGPYQPYSVNISGPYSNIYNGAPNDTLPLIFESDHATWNINDTSIFSNRIELATIGSSQIDFKLNNSVLKTRAISKGDATGGSRHIELLNSSIQDLQGGLTFGDGIWLSLGSNMDGEFDYAQNSIVSYGGSGTVFQPGSFLDAWGNLSFVGSASFGGQLDLHAFPSIYHGQSKITVQGQTFNYGAGSNASPFAFMNVYGNNFNQSTCTSEACEESLIDLQLNSDGLASIGGPLFIYSTDSTTPLEGNLYSLMSLNPNYQGAFDPNNNKFTSIRWLGQPLPNGLTFKQVLTQNALQLLCMRSAIVEPAPSISSNLSSVPFASASADFTSDQRDDVVNLIVGSSNSVQIMKEMGDGTFTQLRTFALPANATYNAIAAGNVINDSAPEIAVTYTQGGNGYIRLYTAFGTLLWTNSLEPNTLPTCVCTLPPHMPTSSVGTVVVGVEVTTQLNSNNSNFNALGTFGLLKSVSGDNSYSQSTPLNSVPRTVHGSDIDDDDLSDVTAAGSTSAESFDLDSLGFIQVVKMTPNGMYPGVARLLPYVPVSITLADDIEGDGRKYIFAACNSIAANIPASTRPVSCVLTSTINQNGLASLSQATGISVGLPVQGKAISAVRRNGGFSLAVAHTSGQSDSIEVIEINTFANGSLSIGNQIQIATGGSVIGLHALQDQGTQKFASVRNLNGFTSGALIESTGYVEIMYGDFDRSGTLDSGDISYILLSYGESGETDLDNSGTTDSGDVSILLLMMS